MGALTAMTILAIASTATSAVGQVRAGKAAKRAGEAGQRAAEGQAELFDYNAAIADLQAKDALARGMEEESRFRRGVQGMIGGQRAAIAASNVDVSYGSAVDVQADTAMLGELDALTIRTNAAREAWGFKVAAVDYQKRAEITRREGVQLAAAGREQQKAMFIGAGATIIGGGASALQQRYGFSSRSTGLSTRSLHYRGAGD
jgi:hypothetical protein